jgi:hypothetical protein
VERVEATARLQRMVTRRLRAGSKAKLGRFHGSHCRYVLTSDFVRERRRRRQQQAGSAPAALPRAAALPRQRFAPTDTGLMPMVVRPETRPARPGRAPGHAPAGRQRRRPSSAGAVRGAQHGRRSGGSGGSGGGSAMAMVAF